MPPLVAGGYAIRQSASPNDAAVLLISLLGSEVVEVFGVLCLTTTRRVIGYHELGRGTLDQVTVHPREVFKIALLSNAASVVVGHNHPSGEPSPSPADVDLTRRLAAAGAVMGIDVLDHIIVGDDDRYWSFKEMGQL